MIDKELAAKLRLNINEMKEGEENSIYPDSDVTPEKLKRLIVQEIVIRELIFALLGMSIQRLKVVRDSMFTTDPNRHDIGLAIQNLKNIMDFLK
jgi:hypothetical protein